MSAKLRMVGVLGVAAFLSCTGAVAQQQKVVRAVMHAPLRVTDPILTTAYISRNHGYMIYDTLFAVDEKFAIRPQMVERYAVSDDRLTWSFTLREGLQWHDGKPVTAEDCIASLQRWGRRDSMGQKLLQYTKELVAADERTFKLVLKEPYG